MGSSGPILLAATEDSIRQVKNGLTSDGSYCSVKLLTNSQLVALSQKIWNLLPGSKVGSKGYLGHASS